MHGKGSKIHLMTRPMYEALKSLFPKPYQEAGGFEVVCLDGVTILPDDIDYIEDLKAAEERGYQKAVELFKKARA